MKNILFTIGLSLFSIIAYGQTYFDQLYISELNVSIFTSLYVEGESIYIVGPITNKVDPIDNSILVKYNNEGEIILSSYLIHDEQEISLWHKKLYRLSDSSFLSSALIYDDFVNKASLLKFDSIGTILQRKDFLNPAYPSESFIRPNCNFLTNEDRIFYSYSFADLDKSSNAKILKIDSNFNIIDSLEYNNSETIAIYSIEQDKNGNLYIGISSHNVNIVEKNYIYRHIIEKRDSALNLIWTYETPVDSLLGSCRTLCPLKDGGVAVASMVGEEYFINPNVNGYAKEDPIIYKLDSMGEWQWTKRIHDIGRGPLTQMSKIIELEDRSLVAAGTLVGGGHNGAILKLNEQGDSLWMRYLVHPNKEGKDHQIYDMALSEDGFYLCGEVASPQRGWFLRLDSMGCVVPGCLSAVEKEFDVDPGIQVYPNPSSGMFTITFREDVNELNYTIHRISGELSSQGIVSNGLTLDLSGKLDAGMYILTLYDEHGYYGSEKLVLW